MYKDIEINHYLLNTEDDKFISSDITNKIINCNFDHYKHLSYTTNIYKNNPKNNFHTAIADIEIEKDYIYKSYIYNYIDNEKQNLIL